MTSQATPQARRWKKTRPADEDIMTTLEVCEMLNLDQENLAFWWRNNNVSGYILGARTIFDRQDLLDTIEPCSTPLQTGRRVIMQSGCFNTFDELHKKLDLLEGRRSR